MNDGRDELLDSKDETISILRDQLREEREARRRADAIITQLTQAPSAPPSVLRGSVEEGGKETARRLVGALAGSIIAGPASLGAVISYVNNAPTLTVLSGVFALAGTLFGAYFGIKASQDAAEKTQREAEKADQAGERADG